MSARLMSIKIKTIFHQIFIHPPHIISLMLIGTFIVTCALLCLLIISVVGFQRIYLINRLILGVVVLAYLICIAFLILKQHYKSSAWMLIILYTFIACIILIIWGINVPIGILILAFVIFMSSIMLGSRYIIPVTLMCICLLLLIQTATSLGIIQPDLKSLATVSGFGDAMSYGTVFGVFALVAWLAGRQTERALQRALAAESGLKKEKDLLSVRLEERTRLLKETQLKEMRQLYNFAELGQLTTVILHELANHLSILTLDIEDLTYSKKHANTIERAKESINNIDMIVNRVRLQISESTRPIKFDTLHIVEETVEAMNTKAKKMNISITIQRDDNRPFFAFGDPLRLSQVLIILINNAIDANTKYNRSEIKVILKKYKDELEIIVVDYCGGISQDLIKSLFMPLRSTKENGLGIGLFVAKQVIETHFRGTIAAASGVNRTEFTIRLPAYMVSSIKQLSKR